MITLPTAALPPLSLESMRLPTLGVDDSCVAVVVDFTLATLLTASLFFHTIAARYNTPQRGEDLPMQSASPRHAPCACGCCFVCAIASQLHAKWAEQYTTPTVYVSSKSPSPHCPALHKSRTC